MKTWIKKLVNGWRTHMNDPVDTPLSIGPKNSIDQYKALSDEEFLHSLYRSLLKRNGDPNGITHHLERLTQGRVSRQEVIAEFLNSEEYRLRTGTTIDKDIVLSNSLSPTEREDLYFNVVLKQDFYGEGYATDAWRELDTTHRKKADYIIKHFNPKKVVDIGCSYGRLVNELRQRGIDAWGIDYSENFIENADSKVKDYIKAMKVEEVRHRIKEKFDLVVCTEVLEHLPLSIIETTIEELKRICCGQILITTPSHGPNTQGRYGFPMHHVEDWVRCTRENRTFTEIPIHKSNGYPHCGHVTLASYQWWTDKFLQHGLIRNYPLEQAIVYDEVTKVYQMGWCVYVLHEATESKITVGDLSEKQLGRGFVCQQAVPRRKIAWTGRFSEFFLKPKDDAQGGLNLILSGGPNELVYPRIYSIHLYQLQGGVDRIERTPLHRLRGVLLPGVNEQIGIDFRQSAFDRKKLLCCEIEVENTWKAERILNSFVWGDTEEDDHERGIGFLEAALV